MDVLEKCTIVYENTKSIYSVGCFFACSVSTPSQKSFVRVSSNLGPINPLFIYNFKGRLHGTQFRTKSYDMNPQPLSFSTLQTVGKLISECTEKAMNMSYWSTTIHAWNQADDKELFYNTHILPIIVAYSEHVPHISFWISPHIYEHVHRYYQDNSIFNWSQKTCNTITAMLDKNPFQLCFETPCGDMNGLCLDLDTVVSFHPVTDENQMDYNVASKAEFFCYNPLRCKLVDDFEPTVLESLTKYYGFVEVVGDYVVNKKNYRMFLSLRGMKIVSVTSNTSLHRWCKENKEDYSFIFPKRTICDHSFLPVNVLYDLPTNFNKICLVHVELWTLASVYRLLLQVKDLTQIVGIGFNTSVGNFLGYNLMHYFTPLPPPVQSPIKQHLSFQDIEDISSNCVSLKVGSNVFHLEIVNKLAPLIKKFASKRITFATNQHPSHIPFDFVQKLKSDCKGRLYKTNERVLMDANQLLFVQNIYEISSSNSIADITGNNRKRKRIQTTQEHISYKRKKKCILQFSNGDFHEFKDACKRISHYKIPTTHSILGLNEDIIVFFNIGPLNPLVIHSLKLISTRVFVIISENDAISDVSCFKIPDFVNI